MKKLINYFVLFTVLLLTSAIASADIAVIVSQNSKLSNFTYRNVKDLYTGRTMVVGDSSVALPLDISANSGLRNSFYVALTGMSGLQATGYWTKMMVTGQASPPQYVQTEEAMINDVKTNETAIGYIPANDVRPDIGVRVLFIIKTS